MMSKLALDVRDRVIRSASAAALALVTAGTFNLVDLSSWTAVLVAAGTAALVELLASGAGTHRGDPTTASLSKHV